MLSKVSPLEPIWVPDPPPRCAVLKSGHSFRIVPAMTRWQRWVAGSVALVTLALGASSRPAWADPAEVESLIAQGNELRRQGHDAQAVPLFKKAYDIDQTPRTAGQLGLVELAAGYPVEAVDHLALALESPQHPWVASNRRSLEKILARAQGAIAGVTVNGTPMGASVTVNGRAVGALPLPAAVRVPAGRVVVSVSAPGYASAERVLQVRGKETQNVSVALEKTRGPAATNPAELSMANPNSGSAVTISPIAAASQPEPAPVANPANASAISGVADRPAEAPASTSPLRVAAWTTAVVAVGGLGAGLALQHASNTNAEEFGRQKCSLVNGAVPVGGSDRCRSLWETRNSEKTWSLVGYVAGGALAVTSAVLFGLSWSAPSNGSLQARAAIRCAPTVVGGIFCRGEF